LEQIEMNQDRFRSASPSQEAVQTRTLIADIGRILQIVESDIATEEERAGMLDYSLPEYPAVARTLVARRENHITTIAVLEKRLANLSAGLFEPA
jgi:hypothetical protein